MSQTLMLEVNDQVYQSICVQAEAVGTSPALLAAAALEKRFNGAHQKPDLRPEEEKELARQRFRQHFGSIDLGAPTGIDNESIDADIAREYGETHEDR